MWNSSFTGHPLFLCVKSCYSPLPCLVLLSSWYRTTTRCASHPLYLLSTHQDPKVWAQRSYYKMAMACATLALEEYQWWKRNKVQNLLNQKLYCEKIFPNLTAHKFKKKKKKDLTEVSPNLTTALKVHMLLPTVTCDPKNNFSKLPIKKKSNILKGRLKL